MTYILATDKPLLWAVGNPVISTGITEVSNLTVSGQTIVFDADENAYLGKVAGTEGTYKPLPTTGWLEAGSIYGYGGGLLIVRQSHYRTLDAPANVPALFSVYRTGTGVQSWIANEPVLVGTHRIYNTIEYVCIQKHTTQSDWTPDKTPALWSKYVAPSPNWAAGVAYKVNDIVLYVPNGFSYKCLQAHTSQAGWNPPAVPALWQKQ